MNDKTPVVTGADGLTPVEAVVAGNKSIKIYRPFEL